MNTPGVHSISLYPNPVKNQLHVKVRSEIEDHIAVELYDAQGKKISVVTPEYNGITTMDLSGLSNGVYLVHILVNDDLITTRKIIKQ